MPVVGDAVDIANTGVYAIEGDWTNAAIGAMAAIPLGGNFLKAGIKSEKKAIDKAEKAKQAEKSAGEAPDLKTVSEPPKPLSRDDPRLEGSEAIVPTPHVADRKLQNLVDNLYKGTTNPNRIGDGTTMDAIRNELRTGEATGGRMHTTKGQETLQGLENWLKRNPNASNHDRLVARSLADELAAALKGSR